MTKANTRAGKMYDAYWAAGNHLGFESYERNLLLKQWTKTWMGQGKRLLDIGCGDGCVGEHFSSLGFAVTGVDISQEAIRIASGRMDGHFLIADVENPLPFEDSCFDVVFWGDNVEHLFSPVNVLTEIRRIIKPDGRMLISCPNIGYWKFRVLHLLRGSIPRNEGHEGPPWAWQHIRFFTPKTMSAFMAVGGFDVKRLEGITRKSPIALLARRWPGLFAITIMAEATPSTRPRRTK